MAADAPPTEPVPDTETELDEANITSSLARLHDMHAALRHLRETIPRVMDSVLVDPPGPEQLHLHFAQAARAAASDIKNFAQIVDDPRSKEALQQAKESKSKNAADIPNWLVTEHEDWLDGKSENGKDDDSLDARDPVACPAPVEIKVEDIQAILETFKESHPAIEASKEESSRLIKIHLPSPAHIHFELQPNSTEEGQGGYTINSKEKTKLHKAILEAVAARLSPDNLKLLLVRL